MERAFSVSIEMEIFTCERVPRSWSWLVCCSWRTFVFILFFFKMFVPSPSFVIVSAVSQSYCCPHLRRHHQRHHGSRHNCPPRPPPRLVVSREFSQNTRYYGILVSVPGSVLSSPAASRSCFFPRWSLLLSLPFLHCHHQHHGQPLCSPSFASLCPCRSFWFTSLLVIWGIHLTSY